MSTNVSFNGTNSGYQAGMINAGGNVTTNIVQSEPSSAQACLWDLRVTDPEDDMERIKKTKGGLLEDSYRWILDNEEFKRWRSNQNQSNPLLWIRGDPGKGKTMLLCGIIQELTRSVGGIANVSFFFCQATDGRINTATAVLRGLIYSLVWKQPHLLQHVRGRYEKAGKSLFEGVNAWSALASIFTDILKDPDLRSTYLVIDAVDECITGLRFLLDLVIQESSGHTQSKKAQLKWILSSRNWPDIIERLDTVTQIAPISLELNEASVSKAVSIFIQYKASQLASVKKYGDKTHDTVCRYLLSHSQNTFLWVALVCQELDKSPRRKILKSLSAFPSGLDALYDRMIDQVHQSDDAELCKQILAIMLTVYRPITLHEMSSLIEVPDDALDDDYDDYKFLSEAIAVCGSFLTLREDTIVFVHQSAKDYLLRKATNELFPNDIGAEHYNIFTHSLETMRRILRRDIFDIKLPGIPIKDVRPPRKDPLAAAQYACVYWVDHLQNSTRNNTNTLDKGGPVDLFIRQSYLYWLEALSLLGSVSYGIQAMQKLEVLIQKESDSQALLDQVRDAYRFTRYYRTAIEISPLQVYCTPLIFSPTSSLTRRHFQMERPDWVLNNPIVEEDWSPCLQTLYGHSHFVKFIAWSQDGSRLASASLDRTVMIWDPATGHSISFKGHNDSVNSIAWSPDGSRLASASSDAMVKIWDPATGHSISLEGHSDWVNPIAWSQDGNKLASASRDSTVRIWDLTTDQSISLGGHIGWVNSIAWSPDGSRLASASSKTVKIWDLATGHSISFKGHNDSVNFIAWSPDGSRLASASSKTVKIWDLATGQSISHKGHSDWVYSIAWSQDGSRLASASDDRTVKIWDPATAQCVSTIDISFQAFLQSNQIYFDYLDASVVISKESFESNGYSLSDDHVWITYHGVNFLWLPTEYRPLYTPHYAFFSNKLAIGCSSGHVLFLELAEQSLITDH
ncbi:uncharacterized protein N7484_011751 [Penicillium longicatenatum]|uniref:uncharacterized protein n=1 Tax=Penicillium longicatenatum TaxID=1561947 RepID=UPI0025477F15|nr:uncharacterized protein N7484_011751 [Penicillium longicatenatum]KAJ5631651.1 hypothetical protein N7484_011751 [Penicillium longicatenatum]